MQRPGDWEDAIGVTWVAERGGGEAPSVPALLDISPWTC